MKVYGVCFVPDYIGIEIDGIYLKEENAIKRAAELNSEDYVYKTYGTETYFVEEFEIVDYEEDN